MVMLGLLGLTLLLGFGLMLLTISGLAGRLAGLLARKRPSRLQWQKRTKLTTLALLLGGVSYSGYTAVYPPDSYYLGELAQVSLRPVPASAEVVDKSAVYPNFHGDDCSYSRIAMSSADFQALLAQVSADQRLRPVPARIAQTETLRTTSKAFSRYHAGQNDQHLSLDFLADGKSVEVNVCNS
jgi:hypothetical protein